MITLSKFEDYTGNIFMTHDNVLKVSTHDKYYVYGFSLVDESFIKVDKSELMPLVPSLIEIMKSDKIKLLLTEKILQRTHKRLRMDHVANALDISVRTLRRISVKEGIFVSDYVHMPERKKPMNINLIN